MKTIRPTHTNVLIEVSPRAEQRPGSPIVIPNAAKGRPNVATVIAQGPEVHDIEPGSIVVFNPYRLKLVIEHGQLANAQGTPVARPGDRAIIDVDDLYAEIAPE